MSKFGHVKEMSPPGQKKITPAQAARLNLTRLPNDESVISAALAFLDGKGGNNISMLFEQAQNRGKTRAEVLTEAQSFKTDLFQLPAIHLEYAYLFPPQACLMSSERYAANLLSRRAFDEVVIILEDHLAISHENHGQDLRALRDQTPEQHSLLIRGDPRATLEKAMERGVQDISFLRPILTNHVIFLTAATAAVRIAALRKSREDPMQGFAGSSAAPTLPMAYQSTIIDPAKSLYDLCQLEIPNDSTDDDAINILKESGKLDDDESSERLVKIMFEIRARIPSHKVNGGYVKDITRFISANIEIARSITKKDFQEAGWMRRSFTMERFGVRATEGAVIVALNLLMARERIEACIDAILGARPLPTFDFCSCPDSIGNNALARTTEALRVEGQSDKSAPREVADKENRNCKQLAIQTKKKIKSGSIDDALTKLRIDPAEFFRTPGDRSVLKSLLTP